MTGRTTTTDQSRDVLHHVWAKSADLKDGNTEGERLAVHTANVLTRLKGWNQRYPEIGRHGARVDVMDLAAWAVLLHDVGKCAIGFQAMLRGGARFSHRHEVLSLVVVGRLDVDDETMGLVAAGVGTHHKDAPRVFELYPFGSADRIALLAELSAEDEAAWESWLSGSGAPQFTKLGFAPLPARKNVASEKALGGAMRALQLLVGRLEAEPATSPLNMTARAMRGLVVLADHAGSAHERLGFAPSLDSVEAFERAAASRLDRGLEPHQKAMRNVDGHALLVAPTGSGKTEAAMMWVARQREISSGNPSVFYVLPYRASLNAMRARIPDYGVPDHSVVLQHSTATSALYGYLQNSKRYTPEVAEREAKREQALGRLMTAPVRVLTPYQWLRALFGLPGHEAVLTDAAGGLFVLDELHAYDVGRLGLILAGVRHLARDCGARVLAMSATFPSVLVRALQDLLGDSIHRIDADLETQKRFVRHTLHIVERDLLSDETFAIIERRFRSGEAVLVVATTVARAQQLYDSATAKLGHEGVALLHGRFTGRDRNDKELALAARVGTRQRAARSSETGAGTLLVATQVVEVSLDVDFDVLFTDPAPIEALLQRFGRVNRGRRGPLRDVVVHTVHVESSSFVYAPQVVSAAMDVLQPHTARPIEENKVQAWVDAAYSPFAEAWTRELRSAIDTAERSIIQANRPLASHPELAAKFDDLFDGTEVVPQTLLDMYEELTRDNPLEASSLRVPISQRQRRVLRRKGLLDERGDKFSRFDVALVPYSSERGLDLKARDDDS